MTLSTSFCGVPIVYQLSSTASPLFSPDAEELFAALLSPQALRKSDVARIDVNPIESFFASVAHVMASLICLH